ncbi:DNA-processing protein DprA [Streptomyces lunaelactis]|uniref:DNA-processing protein DprA n=1 Tax=Streptomyces lunaelactis TaxID=1535768 RepID=UPI001584D2A4|nr:DNA-processing protein DprA [Streptomyces lunaelactis]NUK21655.1 DNA-processing protein DprA [Streptomyces lunaelactis]
MPSPALSERAARAALAAHFTPAQLAADLSQFSAQEVWEQRVRRDTSRRLSEYKPTDELANAQLSCRFIIPSDEVWPAGLADLGPDCPLGLWARGHDQLPQLTASAIAVTGNRNATEQAVARAQAFATAVAEAGHTVTATLAYGVDAAAHRAAAHAGQATLAVLPRGLDRAHPHTHVQLLSSISATGGAVVSLYRPGTETSGATLRASATLLAALARAVILIEAVDHAETAMHTAEVAARLKRPLLAPPATEDVRAEGSNRLLAEQRAVLCPDPARALALL